MTIRKIFSLTAILSFASFAFTACGNLNGNAFSVGELVDKVTSDKDAWIGKDVIVSGYVLNTAGSADAKGYSLSMTEHGRDESERYVDCEIPPGDLAEAIKSETIEVKGKTVEVNGKIASVYTQSYLNMKRVKLESCELKK